MLRFTIRELVLLTLVVALVVGWWLDRGRMAIPATDYMRLKADEAVRLKQRAEFFNALKNAHPNNSLFETASEKQERDDLLRLLSDKAIREYSAPAPKPLPTE